jgi:hypothetical protein
MITLKETKERINVEPQLWLDHLMSFVHNFRSEKDIGAVEEPFVHSDDRVDAILASTAEYLCDELGEKPPPWLDKVAAPKDPWFVAGVDSLMARAIVESPLRFRIRKIFVLESFLNEEGTEAMLAKRSTPA